MKWREAQLLVRVAMDREVSGSNHGEVEFFLHP